ncbi:hypothetical protein [Solitalea longa]|nr:hypothetical protein [Solitalea longa]
MKPLLLRSTICLFLLMAGTYFSSSAQTKKVSFNTSSVVPSAEGTVKVKKDKNGNYAININIDNLAEPKRLTPPKKVYIVWMETAEKGIKSVGHINSSSSMFSKARKAAIETASPYKPVRIFVSAEDDENVEEPGTVVVLTTDSFW